MSKEAVIILLIGATLTGCVTPQQAPMRRISQPFDAEQARGLVAVGASTLRGSAFLRQQGGGVVTCAGSDVTLVPATEYAKHRLTALYGSQLYMSTGVARGEAMQFDPDPPEYRTLTRKIQCDAQGTFQFDRVAAGEFYVITSVRWTAGNQAQGGFLVKKIKLESGATESVVMSP